MNHETLSITPDTSYNPSAQEGISDIDMQILQAHSQMALQVETLAYDPSLSAEQQKEKSEAICLAIGSMSLATEGLDYDTMKRQTELNNQQAYVTELMHNQISSAINNARGENDSADTDEDEEPRRKHRVLLGAR